MGAITERVGAGRSLVSRRMLSVGVGIALAAGGLGGLAPSSGAAGPAGTVTLTVNRDYFGDGVYHAPAGGQLGDPGQPGMTVTATDVTGRTVQKTTDAAGTVAFTAADGLTPPYRLDVAIPSPYSTYLTFAPVKSGAWPATFAPATSFVDPGNGTNVALRVPVWNPADYAQTSAQLAIPVQANGATGSIRALVVRPNETSGTQRVVATQSQIGTTFGVAYDRTGNRIFTSAFAKSYTQYGPAGPAAIYVTDPDNATPNASLFTTVKDVDVVATTPHAANYKADGTFYAAPGTQSLGGLALSDDGTKLYTINLADQRLITIDVANPSSQIATAIPAPACTGGKWRPFGVSVHNNMPYIGGVCDASTSGSRSDLSAVIYAYEGSSFDLVYQHGLAYLRGTADGGKGGPNENVDVDTHWNPWTAAFVGGSSINAPVDGFVTRPEPELATIAFDADGSMILGFRDRSGDTLGNNVQAVLNGQQGPIVTVITGGDVNRVCKINGSFVWDGEAAAGTTCPNHNTGANSGGEPTGAAGVQEFYPGEYTVNQQLEAAQGSAVLPVGSTTITSTFLDTESTIYADGLGFFAADGTPEQDPGSDPTGHSVTVAFGGSAETNVGKSNGLGAIALLAAAAPSQIGDRVWLDADKNGIQNPGELALTHAKVTLLSNGKPVLDKNGQQVVAYTDSTGAYYFGGPATTYQLVPGQKYSVQFDVSTVTNLPAGVSISSLRYTNVTAGTDTRHDSNPTPAGPMPFIATAAVTGPPAGRVDHTIDAGIYLTTSTSPPGGGTSPPTPASSTPHPPTSTTTTTTVLIETGRPGAPKRGNPWYVVAGVVALLGAGVVGTGALRRRANRHGR